jgi:hypothetical protein
MATNKKGKKGKVTSADKTQLRLMDRLAALRAKRRANGGRLDDEMDRAMHSLLVAFERTIKLEEEWERMKQGDMRPGKISRRLVHSLVRRARAQFKK